MNSVSNSLNAHLAHINDLVRRLNTNDSEIAQIDVDMLLAALRAMYDCVYQLPVAPSGIKTVEQKTEPVEEKTETMPTDDSTPVATPVAAAVESHDELDSSPLMIDEDEEPVFAQATETADETSTPSRQLTEEIEGNQNDDLFEEQHETPLAQTTATATAAEPEQQTEEPKPQTEEPKKDSADNRQPSLFDYFRSAPEPEQQRTLADTLSPKKSEEPAMASIHKVSDLRTVININDKFMFMNELFHNNMKGYNDFIIRLNAIDARAEALDYVKETSQAYNWDMESLAVKSFYSIFDKKF
jgi:hypothetical protein